MIAALAIGIAAGVGLVAFGRLSSRPTATEDRRPEIAASSGQRPVPPAVEKASNGAPRPAPPRLVAAVPAEQVEPAREPAPAPRHPSPKRSTNRPSPHPSAGKPAPDEDIFARRH